MLPSTLKSTALISWVDKVGTNQRGERTGCLTSRWGWSGMYVI